MRPLGRVRIPVFVCLIRDRGRNFGGIDLKFGGYTPWISRICSMEWGSDRMRGTKIVICDEKWILVILS